MIEILYNKNNLKNLFYNQNIKNIIYNKPNIICKLKITFCYIIQLVKFQIIYINKIYL